MNCTKLNDRMTKNLDFKSKIDQNRKEETQIHRCIVQKSVLLD